MRFFHSFILQIYQLLMGVAFQTQLWRGLNPCFFWYPALKALTQCCFNAWNSIGPTPFACCSWLMFFIIQEAVETVLLLTARMVVCLIINIPYTDETCGSVQESTGWLNPPALSPLQPDTPNRRCCWIWFQSSKPATSGQSLAWCAFGGTTLNSNNVGPASETVDQHWPYIGSMTLCLNVFVGIHGIGAVHLFVSGENKYHRFFFFMTTLNIVFCHGMFWL